ncbi:UvrD-helicase domain-containing protein [Nonomuraea sp. NPDC046570]|uniref:UvrD-helicase domain-containing protein n=1 Tax=Nonomuraea sp. NPDC046570 TaxID=3155255 RepID=UPI0033ECA7CB
MPRLAIAPEFPRELSALSAPVRRDVMVALGGFLLNVNGAPAPERVRAVRDPRVWTLRLADRHRGVVVRQRDVYWLLTVLPDAEAWSYAQRHSFSVNSVIGVVEQWDSASLERVEVALARSAGAATPLFAQICDGDLLGLGIDASILPLIRLITSEADVEALEPLLPPTQHLPLAVLARDGTITEAWREVDSCRTSWAEPGPVDQDDLHAALLRSPDRAVFAEDQEELGRLVDAPGWCTFLHPPQHRLARGRYDHPVLVTGGAGTGKTLIALHRAAHLARHGGGQVLLVTFSQGLSNDLSAKLDTLIEDDPVRKRVDVDNVDRLAIRLVAGAEGRQPTLVGPGARTLAELTEEALRLLGRTTGDLLDDLEPGRKPYRHVVVDEAQDVTPAQWRLLRALVPRATDDLFVVGDPHQRITDARIALGAVGIHATQHSLRVSYRLPHETLTFGVRLRGGGPAGGLVKNAVELYGFRAVRHGERPMIRAYTDADAELSGLAATVVGWLEDGVPAAEIAVAARSSALVRSARDALAEAGAEVRVTTLHGLKGLEFERVALIGIAEGVVPEKLPEDPATRARVLQRERGLLYVACTRARSLLYVSHSGRGSPLLPT